MSPLLLAALLAADPAPAETPAILVPLVPPPGAAVAPAGEKLICHDIPMPGTRLVTQHMCGTAAQWADYKLVLRQDMDKVQRMNFGH